MEYRVSSKNFTNLMRLPWVGAQTYVFQKQWDKRFGGDENEGLLVLRLTEDGGCVMGGYTSSGISGNKTSAKNDLGSLTGDYWILKIDSAGNVVFDKSYGGNGEDVARNMQCTTDKGNITCGWVASLQNGDISEARRGWYDMWIVKTDSLGNKQWDKRLGGNVENAPKDVRVTVDGGYIIAGGSSSGISGDKTQENWDTTYSTSDCWVVKVNSVGNKLWDKRYGGTKDDGAYVVLPTFDGGYLLGCFSKSGANGNKTTPNLNIPGSNFPNIWLVKIDSAGNMMWDKSYGIGTFIDITPNGTGYMLSLLGRQNENAEIGDPWILKIDSIGNEVWERKYNCGADIYTFSETTDGGYLMAGQGYRSDMVVYWNPDDRIEDCLGRYNTWVMKLDSNFYREWDKTIFTTGDDFEGRAVETHDGCYLTASASKAGIGGYKTQAAWDSSYDYFVVKFCMERVNGIDPLNPPKEDFIQVYPNPFTEEVSIALQNRELREATFTLTDVNGKILYNKEEDHLAPGYTKVLDLRQLPTGVYFITVQTAQGQVVKRVVKE
jgi:hypothetical protein